MRAAAVAGAMAALLILLGRAALADAGPDAGVDVGTADRGTAAEDAAVAVADGGTAETSHPTEPALLAPAAPPPQPPTPIAAPEVDPAEAAAESTRRTEAAWPLAYVDRPQTLLANMDSFEVSGRAYRGPPAYSRLLVGIAYAKGVTDRIELGLGIPRLYCGGEGGGACSPTLRPDMSMVAAVLDQPQAKLAVGAAVTGFVYGADIWARLKLVVPHAFSFEIEPALFLGVQASPRWAWWNPAVTQDGNQSRLGVTIDANFQLTPHVLLWADGVPYIAVAELGTPSETALQVIAGVSLTFTKSFALRASCVSADVLPTRRWEYVPDFRGCALSFLAWNFGPSGASPGVVPLSRTLY